MTIVCDCGCKITQHCLARHMQTEKHKIHLEMKERGEQPKNRYEKEREYKLRNKEYITEWMKSYREENKEALREQKQQYREENREQILEQKKKYREERVRCQCGCDVGKNDLGKHLKTKKHHELLNGGAGIAGPK